jgi:hypothetical protein
MKKARNKLNFDKSKPIFYMRDEVLKTFWRTDARPQFPEEIRVVRFIINGHPTEPRLEYRKKIVNKRGREINGEVKGFTLAHLEEVIGPNIEEIIYNLKLGQTKPIPNPGEPWQLDRPYLEEDLSNV